jgi:hypothetical protein
MLMPLLLWLASSIHVSAQAIVDAAKRNEVVTVQRLLREDPRAVAATDRDRCTPLHYAANLGNLQIIQLLLMYRANVNARQRDGWTALHSAAITSQVPAMQLLCDHGADISALTDDGNAPIHKAAQYDAASSVNFLLSTGVDIDTPNADGNTALAVAAAYGQMNTGEFLIACGANLNSKNKNGRTPLDEANSSHRADFAKMLAAYQQSLDERAARDLVRKTSGLNLRSTYAAWTDRKAITKTVYREDFRAEVPGKEWKSTSIGNNAGPLHISTTPVGRRRFLGEFGSQAVVLTLTDLPEHTEIAVTFDLFIIRSMDGNIPGVGPDIWSLGLIDGPTLLQTTFANLRADVSPKVKLQAYPGEYPGDHNAPCEGAIETNTLGYKFKNDTVPSMDSVYRLRYTFSSGSRAILFRFAGTNMQEADDESWGITNIEVSVPVAAPTTAAIPFPIHPTPKPRIAVHSAPSRTIAIRHTSPKPITRSPVRRPRPAPKPKPTPVVKRIHDKKVAPKP